MNLDFLNRISTRAQVIFWALIQIPSFAALEIIFRFERPYDPNFVHGDVQIYYNAAKSALAGQLPYRDFFFPYPPGSLLFFIPPALISETAVQFFRTFEVWILILDWLALVAVALIALRIGQSLNRTLFLYTLAIPAMGVIVWQRYDLIPAFLVALAFAAWVNGWHEIAWGLLAAGTLVKIYPALITPLLAIADYRAGGARHAGRGLAIFCAVVALGFAPFFIASLDETAQTFYAQTGRGFEIESVGASLMMAASWFGFPAAVFYRRRLNTWEVDSPVAGAVQILFLGLEAAATLLVYWKCWRALPHHPLDPPLPLKGKRGKEEGVGGHPQLPPSWALPLNPDMLLIRFAVALIALNLLTTKVFSAQFVMWLFPLALLAGKNKLNATAILFLIAAALTQIVFPFMWEQLKRVEVIPVIALLVRDAAMLAMAVLMLARDLPKQTATVKSPSAQYSE